MKGNNLKEQKRELIIESAVQVFSEKGYHNASMGEIAAVANIGKGTIYEYFDSKIQLFQQMLSRGLNIYYTSLRTQNLDEMTVEDRLRLILEGHIRFCRENSDLTRIVFWEAEFQDDEVKEWLFNMRKEKERRMQQLLSAGIERGELQNRDPYLMTLMVGGVIGAVWAPLVLDGWDIDAAVLATDITDIIMTGIRK